MNGGSCEDGINSYSCECKEGFSGARCEINVDDCDGVICQNGGACQDGIKSFLAYVHVVLLEQDVKLMLMTVMELYVRMVEPVKM